MPGCGKSEAVRLAKERGIPVFRMGDVVWDEVKRRGLELSDKNVGTVATEERKALGYDIWAKRTIERIRQSTAGASKKPAKLILIDGLRGGAEVDAFKKEFGDSFILIAIHSPPKARLGRILSRKRDDDSASFEQFKGRDERELSWGLGNSIALADHMVINDGDLGKFQKDVDELLKRLMK